MASRISGLDDFGLTRASLSRLGTRPVQLSIQLTGQTVARLRHLKPAQRDARLRETLKKQLNHLRTAFPDVEFVSRDARRGAWTIDAVVPANKVAALARNRYVSYVDLDAVRGRRKKVRPLKPRWFCVWGVVAIQIEGQVRGVVELEDRLVVVKADSFEDAERRLQPEWRRYAKPYMNTDGFLVRWQLVSIRDVYELFEDEIDPRGTEVYSKLRGARMRPEYRWKKQWTAPRRRR